MQVLGSVVYGMVLPALVSLILSLYERGSYPLSSRSLPDLYPSAYLSESRSANRVRDCRVHALAHLEEKKYMPRIKSTTDLLIGSMGCFGLSGLTTVGAVCAIVLAGVTGPTGALPFHLSRFGSLCPGVSWAVVGAQTPENCWQFLSGRKKS